MVKTKKQTKNFCTKCQEKHVPPTGRKCDRVVEPSLEDPAVQVAPREVQQQSDGRDIQLSGDNVRGRADSQVTTQPDCNAKRASAPGARSSSDLSSRSSQEEQAQPSPGIESLLLKELRRVTNRLDAVEGRIGTRLDAVEDRMDHLRHSADSREDDLQLSRHSRPCNSKPSSKHVNRYDPLASPDSSDEESFPNLAILRSSREIQRKVDARLTDLEGTSRQTGIEYDQKFKSKRGVLLM